MNDLKHVAIIMDGNRRWAQKHGIMKTMGHKAGADNLVEICNEAPGMGIEYLTVYAFSTENMKRSPMEVTYLLNLITEYMYICRELSLKNNIRFRSIGDRYGVPETLRKEIELTEEMTSGNTGMILTIAINYGGRDEMIRAFKAVTKDKVAADDITEELVSSYLDTADMPNPDLVIRTSGEYRLSNFMLWQIAYSELVFSAKYWPDFTVDDLRQAIEKYNNRSRRFGADG